MNTKDAKTGETVPQKFADNISKNNGRANISALIELCKMNQGSVIETKYTDMSPEKYFWTGMPSGWYLELNGPAGK